jgi:hypothetical protein
VTYRAHRAEELGLEPGSLMPNVLPLLNCVHKAAIVAAVNRSQHDWTSVQGAKTVTLKHTL